MSSVDVLDFMKLVVAGDLDRVSQQLADDGTLATSSLPVGATRRDGERFFLTEIRHYIHPSSHLC